MPSRKHVITSVTLLAAIALVAMATALWSRWLGNVPVSLYGRVVDPNGTGLGGVKVTAVVYYERLLQVPAPFAGGQRTSGPWVTTTGPMGNFAFVGRTGTGIQITSIDAPGRRWSQAGVPTGFAYGWPGAGPLPDCPQRAITYVMGR